jgi:hypothetical protein
MHTHNNTPWPNVEWLDEFLNGRVLNASTIDEQRAWWTKKIEVKRELARLPPADIDRAAARLLHELIDAEAA